ncbi:MAG TPA: PilN domain-containing protein [Casimicrobiaceae bacterium]
MKLGIDNWRQYLRDAANRAGLPRFWRWWMGELAPLLPSKSLIAVQRRFSRPVIELVDGEAVFWRPDFGEGTTARLIIAERVSLNGDAASVLAAGREAVGRLAANTPGGSTAPRVLVALGAKQVLRKEITLPAAVEQNLEQTLVYDLDRHTPFRPEQLYFDAVVVRRDAQRKLLHVDWAAALKTVVDDARRRVEDWGAVPVAIVPGPATARTRLNLLPNGVRPRQLQWRRWQLWAPIAAIGLFGFAAVIVPLAQKREYAIALNAIDAEARQGALAADSVRTQLESMQADYNYILTKKYAYPNAVSVLDEVTRVLPDDTWLTQLELKTMGRGKEMHRDLYLRGESVNAGKLIALLEDSKLVEQTAPRSPTTKIQGAPGEIFDLSSRLRELPLPASEPVTIGATLIPVVRETPAAPTTSATPASAATNAPTAAPPPAPSTAGVLPTPTAAAAASAPAPTEVPAVGLPPANNGFGPFPGGAAPAQAQPPRMTPRAQRSAPPAGAPVQPPVAAPSAVRPGAVPPLPQLGAPAAAVASPGAAAPAAVPAQPSLEVPPAPVMPGTVPPAPSAPPAQAQPQPQQQPQPQDEGED